MRNTIKILAVIALAAVIGFSFAACGGGDDGGGGSVPTELIGVWQSEEDPANKVTITSTTYSEENSLTGSLSVKISGVENQSVPADNPILNNLGATVGYIIKGKGSVNGDNYFINCFLNEAKDKLINVYHMYEVYKKQP